MSRLISHKQHQQLVSVYRLRERRALSALQAQRQVMMQASATCQRQQSVLANVRRQLRQLDAQREAGADGLSADALRLAADRRRCLLEDQQRELEQLEIAQQQLQQEQHAMDACRAEWQRQGEHLKALDELTAQGRTVERRKASRRNDEVLDDFCAIADQEGNHG